MAVIRFFKIVLKKSLEDGYLKVPKKFSKKHGERFPNPVYLKPEDGTAWKIHWSQHDDEIRFEDGWKEFASYYSLDNGHMLWFEYNRTSNIEVHIFDMSGLEIDYPSADHISDDNSVEILNEPPRRGRGRPKKTKKAPPSTASPSTSKMLKSSAKAIVVNEPPQRGRGRPRKTEKEAPKPPTPSVKTRVVERGPDERNRPQCNKNEEANGLEIGFPSMAHIGDDNKVAVVNEQPRRGRGRPRKTEKEAPKPPSPSVRASIMERCSDEPPRRGRGRPRKKLKAAAEVSSPPTCKILSSVKNEEASQ